MDTLIQLERVKVENAVAQEHAGAHTAKVAIARWQGQVVLPCLRPDLAAGLPASKWHKRTEDGFTDWLRQGGFSNHEA
jgi:hypothetical protein